jgi:hypothetical protein
MSFDNDARKMGYAPLMIRPAVEFFYGSSFRRLLSRLFGVRVSRPSISIPQLRVNSGLEPLAMHSDFGVPFSMATFFNVHKSWDRCAGGELCLSRRDSDKRVYLIGIDSANAELAYGHSIFRAIVSRGEANNY